jgi:hypothetical protein
MFDAFSRTGRRAVVKYPPTSFVVFNRTAGLQLPLVAIADRSTLPSGPGADKAGGKLKRVDGVRTPEIEAWALRAIERVEKHQPVEDDGVELKAGWIDPGKTARRIAGHANQRRGEPILWVIGVDEKQGTVPGASPNDMANWWPQVSSQFQGPTPRLQHVVVSWKGTTTVALYFQTDQVPYVVKNPAYGATKGDPVELEVPWRDGTRIRSADHSDLILLLSPLQNPALKIEVRKGRRFVNSYPLIEQVSDSLMQGSAYYVRVKVVNTGRRTAERCSGYLANVEQWTGDMFRETVYADDLRLVWSHNPERDSMDLLPGVPHWLDVLSTRQALETFFLQTNPPVPKYGTVTWAPTVYKFTINVFAEDTEPSQAFVFLDWRGKWDDLDVCDEAEWEKRKSKLA